MVELIVLYAVCVYNVPAAGILQGKKRRQGNTRFNRYGR